MLGESRSGSVQLQINTLSSDIRWYFSVSLQCNPECPVWFLFRRCARFQQLTLQRLSLDTMLLSPFSSTNAVSRIVQGGGRERGEGRALGIRLTSLLALVIPCAC